MSTESIINLKKKYVEHQIGKITGSLEHEQEITGESRRSGI